MTVAFRRRLRLRVADKDFVTQVTDEGVSGLDVEFDVERSLNPDPNRARIAVYNFSLDTRTALREEEDLVVQLEVGYGTESTLIFRGDVDEVRTIRQGPDVITEFEAGDGAKAMGQSFSSRSYGANASLNDMIGALLRDLGRAGLKIGQASLRPSTFRFLASGKTWPRGEALHGSSWEQLTEVCKACGIEASVQSGSVTFTESKKPLEGRRVNLSFDTGLLSTPEKSKDKRISASSIVVPGLVPGIEVQIQTQGLEGLFRCTQARYTGSTFADPWNILSELQEI